MVVHVSENSIVIWQFNWLELYARVCMCKFSVFQFSESMADHFLICFPIPAK